MRIGGKAALDCGGLTPLPVVAACRRDGGHQRPRQVGRSALQGQSLVPRHRRQAADHPKAVSSHRSPEPLRGGLLTRRRHPQKRQRRAVPWPRATPWVSARCDESANPAPDAWDGRGSVVDCGSLLPLCARSLPRHQGVAHCVEVKSTGLRKSFVPAAGCHDRKRQQAAAVHDAAASFYCSHPLSDRRCSQGYVTPGAPRCPCPARPTGP